MSIGKLLSSSLSVDLSKSKNGIEAHGSMGI